MDLTAVYLLALPAALYLRATRVLASRGYRVPAWQQVSWYGGLAMIGVALLSPLDHLGETDLVSAHMAQHLLIGDLAAPFLVIGLRSPVYAFLLPAPLMAPIARSSSLRRAFRFVRQPWIAAGLWIFVLYSWHFAGAYDAALRSPALHALQHQSFIVTSMLVWLCVLEPARRRTPGGLWKIAHIGAVRLAGMFLGMAFVAARSPFYDGFYGRRALEHGLTPLEDQQIAGALMLSLDFTIMIATLVFVFFRSAQDADIEEERERALAARAPAETHPDGSGRVGIPALGREQ